MAVIVAVDGGGSRCRLAAFDERGELLARCIVNEHASLSLGVNSAWQHVDQGIHQLRRQMKLASGWQPDDLVMGLAGSLQQRRREEFLKLVPRAVRCKVVTDGHAQLLGATDGAPGICLAVGTGSVVHWLAGDGSAGMAGGWGFPVGDEGSGAWLGMRLVQMLIWHRDGKQQDSTLIDAVEQRVGSTVSSIQLWSTESRSSVLAQLAPLVFEHAVAGDLLAISLLEEATGYCLDLISLAPPDLPVYIVGGVGEQLSVRMATHLPERIHKTKGDALRGLWRIWQSGSS